MKSEVDKIPDKKINKEIKGTAQHKQDFVIQKFFFSFIQPIKVNEQPHLKVCTDKAKDGGDKNELKQLPFQFFLQQVKIYNNQPHKVSENNTKCNKNAYATHYQHKIISGIKLVEWIGKENTDKCKPAPSY